MVSFLAPLACIEAYILQKQYLPVLPGLKNPDIRTPKLFWLAVYSSTSTVLDVYQKGSRGQRESQVKVLRQCIAVILIVHS